MGRNLEKSSQLKLNPTVSVFLCTLCKGERVEGTTSAPTGMCGGAGTLHMVVFWERQLSESSDHPVPLVTPSARNPLGRSQNLVFCLDSIYRVYIYPYV